MATESRRRWRCPSCGKLFSIPAHKSDPPACPACAKRTEATELVDFDDRPRAKSVKKTQKVRPLVVVAGAIGVLFAGCCVLPMVIGLFAPEEDRPSAVEGEAANPTIKAKAVERTAPAFHTIRAKMKESTEAQWNKYAASLKDSRLSGEGRVVEVNVKLFGGYEVWIDMDADSSFSVQDVTFDVSEEVGLALDKNQHVQFSGKIKSALNVLGTCQITLDDGTLQ